MKGKIKKSEITKAVQNYFQEYQIIDLMDYGETGNPSLGDISEPYAQIFETLGFEVKNNYSEEGFGDGKYIVNLTIPVLQKKEISFRVKAWFDEKRVIEDVADILENANELSD